MVTTKALLTDALTMLNDARDVLNRVSVGIEGTQIDEDKDSTLLDYTDSQLLAACNSVGDAIRVISDVLWSPSQMEKLAAWVDSQYETYAK